MPTSGHQSHVWVVGNFLTSKPGEYSNRHNMGWGLGVDPFDSLRACVDLVPCLTVNSRKLQAAWECSVRWIRSGPCCGSWELAFNRQKA